MPIIKYYCIICRREYSSISDAENCENSHRDIKCAVIKNYGIHKYPYELEIEFDDGKIGIYTAHKIE